MEKHQNLFLQGVLVYVIALVISFSFSIQSYAQQVNDEGSNGFALEEITVTAQRKEERLKDVPIAVSVLSGERMDDFGITSFQDVSEHLPNVNIVTGPTDYLNIRGVGSSTNLGFEQSVGTFVDGIYHSRARSSQVSLFDISRVEVLRGPQTLFFGANSIAGALNITTRRPGDAFGYNLSALYGTDDEYRLGVGMDIPLTDMLNIRIAGRISGMDGYIDTPQGDAPNRDNKQGRIYLAWEPSDSYQSDLRVDYGTSKSKGGLAYQLVGCPAPDGFVGVGCANFLANNNGVIDDKLDYHSDTALGYLNFDFNEFVWTNTFTIGESSSLILKTGYYKHDSLSLFTGAPFPSPNTGASGLPPFLGQLPGTIDPAPIHIDEKFDQFSQEIRLQSNTGSFFDYMVGAYYSKSNTSFHNYLGFFFMDFGFLTSINIPTTLIPHDIIPGDIIGGGVGAEAEDETKSVFAAFNFRPTDRLTVNLGGRFTRFEKLANRRYYFSRVDGNLDNWEEMNDASQTAFNLITGGDSSNFSPNSRIDDDFMPTLSIQYDITDSVMGYASYSQGFKAGGYSYANIPVTFDPEYVDSYEVGLKGFFMNYRLFAGINYFYNKYDDLQETAVMASGATFISVVRNAASSLSKGFEVDTTLLISDNLMFKANLATLNSKNESFPNGACTMQQQIAPGGSNVSCIQDLSGKDRGFSPSYSGNISAEYDLYIGSYKMRITPSVFFTDGFYLSSEADPWLYQDSYTKFNLRVSLSPSDEKWEVALIGKNLNDETTSSLAHSVFGSDGSARYIVGRPLSVALQFTIKH